MAFDDVAYACEGKVQFTRRSEAIYCKRLSEERDGGDSYHIYLCPWCHAYHVGHARLRLYRREVRQRWVTRQTTSRQRP